MAGHLTCMECGWTSELEGFDVLGADPGCVFCIQCHAEISAENGYPAPRPMTIRLDKDDERAVHMAIAKIQSIRVGDARLALPDGTSDTAGAALGEICRQWLDARGEWPGING